MKIMKKGTKKLNNKGFSLVELIIVVAIMAVLIGVLAPQYLKYVERSRESADLDNYQSIISAIEIYAADPSSATAMTAAIGKKITFTKGSAASAETEIGNILTAQGITIGNVTTTSTKYGTCVVTLKKNSTTGYLEFKFSGTNGSAVKTALGR